MCRGDQREIHGVLTPEGAKRIALPGKVQIDGLLGGRVIVTLNEDWTPEGAAAKLVQGSIVALDLEAVRRDPPHLKPYVVFTPTATEFAQPVETTKNRLLLTTLKNVQGRLYSFIPGANGSWTRTTLNVPDNRTVAVVTTD